MASLALAPTAACPVPQPTDDAVRQRYGLAPDARVVRTSGPADRPLRLTSWIALVGVGIVMSCSDGPLELWLKTAYWSKSSVSIPGPRGLRPFKR